ncbi:phosphotransferase [Cellulomonas sp. KRMCY2]|uniref:phosphotransferase n=1 Tax=Cellulomonas sp. KRMCY2 TaxID=1304865 RepID=UPI00045EB972|nr:phosphotransferase [Cellulomonas sp. KRMCY2]
MTGRREWTAERVIDAELAGRVIAEQFPDLAGLPVRTFDAGWDNVVLAVGDAWLFRFIHRRIALDGSRRELAVLRHLADRFAVPIPHPVFVGTPTPEVGWPFWGTRALPGRELAEAGLPSAERTDVAASLGSFLRELHAPDLAAATTTAAAASDVALPSDPLGRADASRTATRARERLGRLVAAGIWAADPRVDVLLDRAAAAPPTPPGQAVLVHGDLHARHVLVDGRALAGVIDWGDTALADPSVDLMIGYSAFEGASRTAFLDAYGDVPPDRELRARTTAVSVSAALAEYAAGEGMDALLAETLAGLGRAVE